MPLHSRSRRRLGFGLLAAILRLTVLFANFAEALAEARGKARAPRADLLAKSGTAVELAGDVDTLLLDKTGTITLVNRQARRFLPAGSAGKRERAARTRPASSRPRTCSSHTSATASSGCARLGFAPRWSRATTRSTTLWAG